MCVSRFLNDFKNLVNVFFLCFKFPENVLDLFIRYCQLFYLFGEYKMAKRNLTFYIDHIWYVMSNQTIDQTILAHYTPNFMIPSCSWSIFYFLTYFLFLDLYSIS